MAHTVAAVVEPGARSAAAAAVVEVTLKINTFPVAVGVRPKTSVARAIDTDGRRRVADFAAGAAVEFVIVEIGAVMAATGLPNELAVVAAGPAVRVIRQVAAESVATRRRAAGVVSAGSTDATGVAVARATDRQALRLLRLRATFTKGCARVWAVSPGGGCQPQRGQDRAGENGPQPAQRFAP